MLTASGCMGVRNIRNTASLPHTWRCCSACPSQVQPLACLALVVAAKDGMDEGVGLCGRQRALGSRACAVTHGTQQAVQVLMRICMVAQPVPAHTTRTIRLLAHAENDMQCRDEKAKPCQCNYDMKGASSAAWPSHDGGMLLALNILSSFMARQQQIAASKALTYLGNSLRSSLMCATGFTAPLLFSTPLATR